MLPSEDDSLDINYSRSCDVIKEDCLTEDNKELIPLNIVQAVKSVSVLDSILGSDPVH